MLLLGMILIALGALAIVAAVFTVEIVGGEIELLGVVGAMVVAHRTAQSAADLAALAGARAIAVGDHPCTAAAGVAAANGAHLDGCTVTSHEVTVEVTVPGPRWLGQSHDLTARARAGPA